MLAAVNAFRLAAPVTLKRSVHISPSQYFLTKGACVLCGRRNYSNDDSESLEIIRSIKESDVSSRDGFARYSRKVQSLNEDDLLERFRSIQRLNIIGHDTVDALPLLVKHPFTIRSRVEVMRECGFFPEKITASNVTKYLRLSSKPICYLKKKEYIPQNLSVLNNILQYVDLEPQHYPEEELDTTATILGLRISIIRAFLKYKFKATDAELKMRGQSVTRLWNKSFATINRNIHLVENEVGMPTQTLRKHLYLLSLNTANTETILREVKSIGGVDIHTALLIRPKILCNTCGNLTKMLKILEEKKIDYSFNYPLSSLFTLSAETVNERIDELDEIEYFSTNKHHPRISHILVSQPKAKRRLKILEQCNLEPSSLNTLVVHNNVFEKFLTDGAGHAGKDLYYYFVNRFGCDFQELKKTLKRHPFWGTVSVVNVSRNHKFLAQYFSNDEILDHAIALFYPHEIIKKEFHQLETREGLDCCKENGRIRKELVLPLMTYFIERESNFSYHGIFLASATEASDAPHGLHVKSLENKS